MKAKLHIGTSGYSYAPWKGKFYPQALSAKEMLAYYAARFPTVEINSTFYRLPLARTLEDWAGHVPPNFVFAFKVPGAVTHCRWSAATPETLGAFFAVTQLLGARLGPLLFQFPPYLKKDAALITKIVARLPAKGRAAFEFRHASWFDEEIYGILREHKLPLVYNDADVQEMPFVATAPWGYLRLRRTAYTEQELSALLLQIRKQPWRDCFVFFKHEDTATGPALGARLTALAASH